jgi:hypothetical protein
MIRSNSNCREPARGSSLQNTKTTNNLELQPTTTVDQVRNIHPPSVATNQHQPQLDFGNDPNSDSYFGDNHTIKTVDHVRFYFQNVNGLPHPEHGHPIDSILQKIHPLQEIKADYIGIAETNL